MEKEYMIAFSSFYKAAYARDMLEKEGMNSTLRRLPTELVRSCGTGLYLKTEAVGDVKNVFERKQIIPNGIYEIKSLEQGGKKYAKVR